MKKIIIAILALLSLSTSAYALSDTYCLLDNEGFICVFEESETSLLPSFSTGIPVKTLPLSDQQLLKKGITVQGKDELLRILEDFGS